MSYVVVDHVNISSPVAEGLYEESSGTHFLSQDEIAVSSKTYYMYEEEYEDDEPGWIEVDVDVGESVVGYYELSGTDYVPTSDTVALAGKSYYYYYDPATDADIYDEDSLYYVDVPLSNPHDEGFYEITEDGYTLSEDASVDPEKTYYRLKEESSYEDIQEDVSAPVYDPAAIVDTGVEPYSGVNPIAADANFIYAKMAFVDDPHAAGYYEKVNGAYVLTSDTSTNSRKVYYEHCVYSDYYVANMAGVTNPAMSLTKYYEVVSGSYVLTQDTTVVTGKTYYRSRRADRYDFRPDPSFGQEPATWDDIPYEA